MTNLDFSASGFSVRLAEVALEQIQRSTMNVIPFFFTENTVGSACISYRRFRSLVSDRQRREMVALR